ncbi:hypothetical protein ACPF8X_00180 [Streptomyces sp. G35A]
MQITPRAAPFGVVAVLLLMGCTVTDHGSQTDETQAHDAIPPMKSAADRKLPIESYMFTDRQREHLETAARIIQKKCMERFGFDYRVPGELDSYRPKSLTELRYGITDKSTAEKYGYKPEGSRKAAEVKDSKPLPGEFALVLLGVSKLGTGAAHEETREYKGKKIPRGGCVGESRVKLHDSAKDGGGGNAEIVEKINATSWQVAYEDRRVQDIFVKWSHCMKRKGYTYADPMAANNDPKWSDGDSASSAEKSVAMADAECKEKFNVVGVWYAIECSYQEDMISRNREALHAVREQNKDRLKAAQSVISR